MDLRNTKAQLDEAIAELGHKPTGTAALSLLTYEVGSRHGWEDAIASVCNGVLAAANDAMTGSLVAQGQRKDPLAGDLEAEANYLLGIYQQLRAAYVVAAASKQR